MNRRGFLKCIALTPLVGLLKPKQPVQWVIPEGGVKQRKGIKYPVYTTPGLKFSTVSPWQGRVDIKRYRQAIRKSDANISNIGT